MRFFQLLSLSLFFLLLSACGILGGGAEPTPRLTPRPTATFTPRSTELPVVPTPILIGSAEQPIKIAIHTEDNAKNQTAARQLTEAFNDELDTFSLGFYEGVVVEFEIVESEQELLYRLCNSNDTLAFVDSLTFIAAERQCGAEPALQVEIEGNTGQTFDLVVFPQRIFNITALRGFSLCIKSFEDVTSFIHPSLAFRAAGLDPLDDFSAIIPNFETDLEMVVAVSGKNNNGRPVCDAAAISPGVYDDIVEELLDPEGEYRFTETQARNLIGLLEPTWRPLPYDILVAPPDRLLPIYLRAEIIQVFEGIQEDAGADQANLQELIRHDTLKPVQVSSYNSFRDWINSTGWDMAAPPLN